MDEIKQSDIVIEGTTASWSIQMEGDVSGTFTGQFRFRCFLSPTQRIAANREMRALLGEHPMLTPEHESFLAYSLSQLKYRIITSPPFWKSGDDGWAGDIPDENVIAAVLNAAIGAEKKYKDQLKARKVEALERSKKAVMAMLKRDQEGEEDDQDSEESQEGSNE